MKKAETKMESGDLYVRLKDLQRQLEILDIQEDYIKNETKSLKRELIRAKVRNQDSYTTYFLLGGDSACAIRTIGNWSVL